MNRQDAKAPRRPFICAALAAAVFASAASAQSYPSRPIRYIVPQAPGGSSDTLARVITQRVAEGLGQQLVVDNRPGATGIIGTEVVARANPDGHTLLQVATSHATNPAMLAKLPYDTVRDFAPVSLLSQQPNLWLAHPSVPVKTIKDLVAYAKAKPGQVNFASSGTGGSQLPEVPTVAESGVKGYEAIAWQGLVAPAGTPKDVIARINTEFVKALKQPDVAAKLNEQGFETVASTPEWFAQYIKSEIAKWTKVIKAAGIKGTEG